jgi:hypothetical protein
MEPQVPVKKKGLSPIAWVAIGCVGLLVLGGIVAAMGTFFVVRKAKDFAEDIEKNPAATVGKTFALVNPDVDYVGSDEDAGTVTFLNNKTDEEFTVDVKDIQEGKISIRGKDGSVTFGATEQGGAMVVEGKDGRTVVGGDERGLTVTGPDGETRARFGAGAPEEIPDWLRLYPEAKVVSSFSTTQNGKDSGAVTMDTDDSLDDVVSFYRRMLDEGSFRIVNDTRSTQETTQVVILGAKGDDGETFNMMATRQDGRTQAVVSYGME